MQNLANTAWAFATLAVEDRELRHVVMLVAVCKVGEFNLQGLANSAWASATLALEDPELLEAMWLAAVCKVGEFNPQGPSNTAWASATLQCRTLSCWRWCGLRRCVRPGCGLGCAGGVGSCSEDCGPLSFTRGSAVWGVRR